MPAAGETVIAGKVPGERIATTIRTSDSAAVTTTETVVDTVVAAVVIGRIYRVKWHGRITSSVAADDATVQIREDSVSGTSGQGVNVDLPITTRTPRIDLEFEYTADATEDKTFVVTILRIAGTGSITASAGATTPTYLYVEYIRG